MGEDPSRFLHKKLVIHEVPRQVGDKPDPPILSQFELPLEDAVATFFKDQTTRSLGDHGADVSFRLTGNPKVPTIIRRMFENEEAFLELTQQMTKVLADAQGGTSNAGLLSVALGEHVGRPAVAIMKLDKAHGVRVQTVNQGKMVALSPKHINDLMLTQQTRVFKVGMFVRTSDEPEVIVGTVSDEQQRGRTRVADFFLSEFLGCELVQHSNVSTERFFETVVGFINTRVPDVTKRAEYMRAVVAELASNATSVNRKAFVRDHVALSHQKELSDLLHAQHIPTTFKKDVSEIKSKLSRMVIDFENGASVIAPYEVDPSTFRIDNSKDGRTKVTVHDKVEKMGGRR
jgi:hypothetical protein